MTLPELRDYLAKLPSATTLPASWFLGELDALEVELSGEPELYDVAALAKRWKRGASTVRGILEAGDVQGAYRHRGREWRVPKAAVLAYEAGQQQQHGPARRIRPGKDGDRWNLRRVARGEGRSA